MSQRRVSISRNDQAQAYAVSPIAGSLLSAISMRESEQNKTASDNELKPNPTNQTQNKVFNKKGGG